MSGWFCMPHLFAATAVIQFTLNLVALREVSVVFGSITGLAVVGWHLYVERMSPSAYVENLAAI